MTLIFESVGRIKQTVLPNVVGPHPSTEGLNRTKRLRELLPNCLHRDISLPAFRLQLKHWFFLGLKPVDS